MPTMVPKVLFSDRYKGLHEIVTEIVGRYTNLVDTRSHIADSISCIQSFAF